jgi:hypothetical protein
VEAVGEPLLMGPLAGVLLFGTMVFLMVRLPSCNRVEGVGAPSSDDSPVDASAGIADDVQGKQKRKRKDKEKLECTICTEDHYTNQCPQLRGPKPAVAFCGAAEDGMGFF